jgi:hypothetical protein
MLSCPIRILYFSLIHYHRYRRLQIGHHGPPRTQPGTLRRRPTACQSQFPGFPHPNRFESAYLM